MRALGTAMLVLVRPGRAFTHLRDGQRRVWLAALIVLVATTLVHVWLSIPHVLELQDEIVRQQGVQMGVQVEGADQDSAALPPGMEENLKTIAVISAFVFGPLGVVVGALVLGAIFMGVAKAWGGEASYAMALGMLLLSKMPDAVRSVVQSLYTAATGEWVLHQGLSALVAEDIVLTAPGLRYSLLSLVDVYAVWHLLLLGLGLTIAMRMPRKRAWIVVAAYAAIGVAATAASAGLASLAPTGM